MPDLLRDNLVATVIVLCEVSFWVLIVAGLSVRYLLRRRRAGGIVLTLVPLVDVVLVVAATLDLHRGAEVSGVHSLAAIYLGFSVAFGPSLIRWADVRFAHRFAGGPAPVKPAKGSREQLVAMWREWFRVVLAASIASVTLLAIGYLGADAGQRESLLPSAGGFWVIVVLWFVFGPAWELGARSPATRRQPARAPSARRRDASADAAGAGRCDGSR